MLINFLNWCWIALSTGVTGTAIAYLLETVLKVPLRSAKARLVIGMVFATVYAETFSLFYRVGVLATLGLLGLTLMGVVIILICNRRRARGFRQILEEYREKLRAVRPWQWMTAGLIALFFLAISASTPYLGDTYMYHIQAVEWIERYGIVKGLGNLHFRFAYNSAFECLAALYSFSSVLGQSLHAANGFYAALLVIYCAVTFQWRPGKKCRLRISDLLKISAVIYIFGRLMSYGSADTDPLVMHCITYIFIRWVELLEEREKRPEYYGLLCVLGIYACTVKLSAGLIVLLILSPLYQLIRKGEWKKILVFALMSFLIVLPFFARNVIISGYLLYPYAGIDLFRVDWKMPVSVVQVDRDGIVSHGRAIQNLQNWSELSMAEWLPIWFASLNLRQQLLFVLDLFGCLLFLVHLIRKVVQRKKPGGFDFLSFVSAVCFLFWMLSAPLMRYGEFYIWVLAVMTIGGCLQGREVLAAAASIVLISEIISASTLTLPDVGLVVPADYKSFYVEGHETDLEYADGRKVIIYTPNEGGMSDYDYFPETPEEGQLRDLIFRGDRLEDGFRSSRTE